MSAISLENSIRTCKVDANAWASRMQSDRFQNPNIMVCPLWNGVDSAGRPVHPYSFAQKRPGCHSAMDRVLVENDLRPQYAEYVNLDAMGLQGNLDDGLSMEGRVYDEEKMRGRRIHHESRLITGNFGSDFGASNINNCHIYSQAMKQDTGANASNNANDHMQLNGTWKQGAHPVGPTDYFVPQYKCQ